MQKKHWEIKRCMLYGYDNNTVWLVNRFDSIDEDYDESSTNGVKNYSVVARIYCEQINE